MSCSKNMNEVLIMTMMVMMMVMMMMMILWHFNLWPLWAEGLYWQMLLSNPENSFNLNIFGSNWIRDQSKWNCLNLFGFLKFNFSLLGNSEKNQPWWGGWSSPCPQGCLLACLREGNCHPRLGKIDKLFQIQCIFHFVPGYSQSRSRPSKLYFWKIQKSNSLSCYAYIYVLHSPLRIYLEFCMIRNIFKMVGLKRT